jgi:GTPase SAR1 family protein
VLTFAIVGNPRKLIGEMVYNYTKNEFGRKYPFISPLIGNKNIVVNEIEVKLILHYTLVEPSSYLHRTAIYRTASAGAIVFDMSDCESFDAVPDWLEEFNKIKPSLNIPIVILGINTDYENVTAEEGKSLAEQLNLTYFETSSPTFENIDEVFEHLAKQVIGGNQL